MTSTQLKAFFKRYIKVRKETDHAKLSASGSDRWLGCPGSINLAVKHGLHSVDNVWSIDGTHAHSLMEFILENPLNWKQLLATKEAKEFKEHIEFSASQLEAVLVAVRFVSHERMRMKNLYGVEPQLFIEAKVELKGVGFGTSDVILYHPYAELHVMDYKNGKSVVEPEGNTQGLYYGIATAEKFGWNFSKMLITIIQPNAPHKRGPVRTWEPREVDLEIAHARFLSGAQATKNPKAKLVADQKYCWFCVCRQICPEQLKVKEKKAYGLFQR